MNTVLPRRLPLAGILSLMGAGLLLPAPSQGQAGKPAKTPAAIKSGRTSHTAPAASPAMYECPMCHERVTAAKARSQHLLCACCKEKLIPVKTTGENVKNVR